VEEAFWAGDKAAAGALKNLITEDEIMFERKGVDAISAFTRLIFTSNEDWAAPVGVDERRFLVVEVESGDNAAILRSVGQHAAAVCSTVATGDLLVPMGQIASIRA
jgi:hypothetical protein